MHDQVDALRPVVRGLPIRPSRRRKRGEVENAYLTGSSISYASERLSGAQTTQLLQRHAQSSATDARRTGRSTATSGPTISRSGSGRAFPVPRMALTATATRERTGRSPNGSGWRQAFRREFRPAQYPIPHRCQGRPALATGVVHPVGAPRTCRCGRNGRRYRTRSAARGRVTAVLVQAGI